MRDNKSRMQEPKMYTDHREASHTCFHCKEPIKFGLARIVRNHLFCPPCYDERQVMIAEHARRIWEHIEENGNIYTQIKEGDVKNGTEPRPIDEEGLPLTWLIQQYPNDYSIHNVQEEEGE